MKSELSVASLIRFWIGFQTKHEKWIIVSFKCSLCALSVCDLILVRDEFFVTCILLISHDVIGYDVMWIKITHPRAVQLICHIKVSKSSVIRCWMVLRKVIGLVSVTFLPIQLKLTLVFSIAEPIIPHVNCFWSLRHKLFR